MTNFTQVSLFVALSLFLSTQAMSQSNSSGDFTLPTFGEEQTGPCAEQKRKPDWFNEGYEVVPQRWRRALRLQIYTTLAWEGIAETGQCSCDDEFPDPEAWREQIEEIVDLYRDDVLAHYDEKDIWRQRKTRVSSTVVAICSAN